MTNNAFRLIRTPNLDARCACGKPAEWFLYLSLRSHSAIALCNAHALVQVGGAWASGIPVTVCGMTQEPPEPFRQRGER